MLPLSTAASREIESQINKLRDLQLVYAAAEKNLDAKDKSLAEILTAQWRQKHRQHKQREADDREGPRVPQAQR